MPAHAVSLRGLTRGHGCMVDPVNSVQRQSADIPEYTRSLCSESEAEVFGRSGSFGESGEQLDREWKDNGGVLLGGDLGQGLQVAQLECRR